MYPAAVRERGVHLVLESQTVHQSQWAAITATAATLGCTAETLRSWVRTAERTAKQAVSPLSAEPARVPF